MVDNNKGRKSLDFNFDDIPKGKQKPKRAKNEIQKVSKAEGFSSRESDQETNNKSGRNRAVREKVQYSFGLVPVELRDALEELRKKQEPNWPKEFFLKKMYLALCKELGETP